jgi:hypothetical protein
MWRTKDMEEQNGVSVLDNNGINDDEYGEFVLIVDDNPATAPTSQ